MNECQDEEQALSSLRPETVRNVLELRETDLAGGAAIYQLTCVPSMNEFAVRG